MAKEGFVDRKSVTLSDALVNLRKDLLAAEEKARGQNLRFKVEDIEVEFLVTTALECASDVGADFWVLSTRAELKKSKETGHKVRLKLKPITEGDGDLEVSGTIPSE